MGRAIIGVGSNLGSREALLLGAWRRLAHELGEVERSLLYETAPVGPPQPRYLNAAFGVQADCDPETLMSLLLSIEAEFGRKRGDRWGPRTLDLDLLVFEGETRCTPGLTLPHPSLLERSFALAPLLDVAPEHQLDWAPLLERLGRPSSRPWFDEGGAPADEADALALRLVPFDSTKTIRSLRPVTARGVSDWADLARQDPAAIGASILEYSKVCVRGVVWIGGETES